MAINTWDTILPEVQPHVAGAPEPLVLNAIRNASIDFCERAWVWFAETTPQALVANQQDYTLTIGVTNAAIAQIMYGYFNGKPMDPVLKDDAIFLDSNWRNRTGLKPQKYLATDSGTKVTLIPVPSANVPAVIVAPNLVSNGITFTVALKPTRAATGVQDFIYEKYLEDIANGAIHRVLAIPNKPWSNVNVALARRNLFLDGCSNARQDSSKSWTRATLRSRVTGVAAW